MKPTTIAVYEHAVMVLALFRAKSAVQAQILANGQKLGQFTSREINEMRQAYFATHMEELITKAVADIATSPHFERWRCSKLYTRAQKQKSENSTTSVVQNLGAK